MLPKKLRVLLPVVLVIGLVLSGCANSESDVAKVGSRAPEITLENLYGQTISLSDYRGEVVLLNFWYTGCTACHDMLPFLQELYDEGEVVLLTVNPGEAVTTVVEYMEYFHLTLPVLFDNEYTVYEQYGVQYTPTTFFIDENGVVRDKVIGAFPTKKAIEDRIAAIQ